MHHFRVPQAVVIDNGPQFDSQTFQNFYLELGIKNFFPTPRFPQSNR